MKGNAMKIKIDHSEVDELFARLENIRKKAIPYATRFTLNKAVFNGRSIAQREIDKRMTLRNAFTKRGVVFDKATGNNIRTQCAKLGAASSRQYLAEQETGITKTSSGAKGLKIPTPTASGEGMHANPIKKNRRKRFKLQNIRLSNRKSGGKSKGQKTHLKIMQTAKSSQKLTYLELPNGKRGIFQVKGGKRKPKIFMVWNMTKRMVKIPKNPWLASSTKIVNKSIPNIFVDELKNQIEKWSKSKKGK